MLVPDNGEILRATRDSAAPSPLDPDLTMLDPDLTMEVFAVLRDVRRGIGSCRLRQVMHGDGPESLDLSHYDTLHVVARSGSCRVGDLASTLRVDPSTVTRSVERLEQAGFVERSIDPNDRRVVLVTATAAGLESHADYANRTVATWQRVLRPFSPEELTDLIDKMRMIVTGVDDVAGVVDHWPNAELTDLVDRDLVHAES